jgi:broad specificity phosphatase PhoE
VKSHLPNHPTQLYFIRHGEVEEKYHKVFGGSRIDMALSPLGQKHGVGVAAWLKDTRDESSAPEDPVELEAQLKNLEKIVSAHSIT